MYVCMIGRRVGYMLYVMAYHKTLYVRTYVRTCMYDFVYVLTTGRDMMSPLSPPRFWRVYNRKSL